MENFWRFENSTSGESEATLYIYGDIALYDMGWWNWPDDVVPNKFKNQLNALGDVDTIHVRINSNGGSVFGAYAIMNLLKSHKAQIITYNDGIAASAATLIAMAGDRIISALGAIWMIHLPATWGIGGNVHELQKAIEILNVITEGMLDIYHARTGIERDTLLQMMNEDTWMSGSDALERGFIDEVSGLQVEAYLNADKTTAFLNKLPISLKDVRNKEAFVAMLPAKTESKPPIHQISNHAPQNKKEETVMNLADLKANHPEIYNAAVQEGITQASSSEAITNARTEGVTAERARIQEITNMALPGMETLTSSAMFETGITAAEYAMEIIKAQKEKGVNYLNSAKADAEELGNVKAAGAPMDDTAEEEALLAYAGDRAKSLRG